MHFILKVGDDGGRWISTVSRNGVHTKVEAVTKPECIYTITQHLHNLTPTYNNFTKWYCYPVQHSQVATMTSVREHILELLPLQFYVDRHLFTKRVEIALEVLLICRFSFNYAFFHVDVADWSFTWCTEFVVFLRHPTPPPCKPQAITFSVIFFVIRLSYLKLNPCFRE